MTSYDVRRRRYLLMMGTALLLIVLAWFVVRHWSTPVAIAMSAVAAVLMPASSIVANAGTIRRLSPPRPQLPPRELD